MDLLTAPEVPGAVSQLSSLDDAEQFAREALAFVLDVEPDSFDVVVRQTDLEPGVHSLERGGKAGTSWLSIEEAALLVGRPVDEVRQALLQGLLHGRILAATAEWVVDKEAVIRWAGR